jgi:hypothetical protein
MALIYPMPMNVPDTVSNSYQRQNTLMYAVMADHLSLSLTNLDNSSAPKVQAGSVFGVNGGLFYVPDGADEAISGTPATGQNYVYAVPKDGGAAFQYSATKPVWSATKGGWYNGNNRAVAKVYYVSSQYNNKVLLDRQEAMYEMNKIQPVPTSGGTLVVTGVVNEVKSVTLEPGRYRYEIKAGKGGNGGFAESNKSGLGADGESRTGILVFKENQVIYFGLGGDGENGKNGDGGGGGCSGGSAFIKTFAKTILCIGGSGGGGMGGGGLAGGGGAGGYGTGSHANANLSGSGYEAGGAGGSNGVGGDGGIPSASSIYMGGGAGGSGYLKGGKGGKSFAKGEDGGGYGERGGKGGSPIDKYGNIHAGADGGLSATGEYPDPTDKDNTLKIQFQGGGGGGGNGEEIPGSPAEGGGALIASSSGYLLIYRMAA